MSDWKLLEVAAKAAGLEIDDHIGRTHDYWAIINTDKEWNPLTDDGDALRLSVKMGMIIGTYANYSTVDLLTPNQRIETITVWHSSVGNDPYAATRRAIVRAAAEIGKATSPPT